jgi:hypothetical protein
LRAFDGGRDELSRDNLVQLVVEQVASLRERGPRGQPTLPPEVLVTLSVPIERVAVVRGFVTDPQFDHDVDDELVNRLASVPVHAMPLRIYEVYIGERLEVGAIGRAGSVVVRLSIAGGDREGQVHLVPARMRTLRVGRGPWHGADQRERNDLVVSDADPFVSRRAARLRRAGAAWEVEALDQGGSLVVVRADGTRVRPHNAPTRWVTLRAGDALEFNDNAQKAITVQIALDKDPDARKEPAPDEWSDSDEPSDEADTQ